MAKRTATCSCGQARIFVETDPIRTSICHCFPCQKRTGRVFGVQARWRKDQVRTEGETHIWRRIGEEEGSAFEFHFCPTCGSTVWFTQDDTPDLIAVPVGAFADPGFPIPTRSHDESRSHNWVMLPDNLKKS